MFWPRPSGSLMVYKGESVTSFCFGPLFSFYFIFIFFWGSLILFIGSSTRPPTTQMGALIGRQIRLQRRQLTTTSDVTDEDRGTSIRRGERVVCSGARVIALSPGMFFTLNCKLL